VGIIVSEGVVVQAGFAVEVLALEAQVLLGKGGGLFFVDGAAPDLAGQASGDFAVAIGQIFRCAVEVGVKVKGRSLQDAVLAHVNCAKKRPAGRLVFCLLIDKFRNK